MTHPHLHDGTCAAGHCRTMPDAFCRTCKRWYCTTHAPHTNHITYLTPGPVTTDRPTRTPSNQQPPR